MKLLRAACRIQDMAAPGFTLWHHDAVGGHKGDGGQGGTGQQSQLFVFKLITVILSSWILAV